MTRLLLAVVAWRLMRSLTVPAMPEPVRTVPSALMIAAIVLTPGPAGPVSPLGPAGVGGRSLAVHHDQIAAAKVGARRAEIVLGLG